MFTALKFYKANAIVFKHAVIYDWKLFWNLTDVFPLQWIQKMYSSLKNSSPKSSCLQGERKKERGRSSTGPPLHTTFQTDAKFIWQITSNWRHSGTPAGNPGPSQTLPVTEGYGWQDQPHLVPEECPAIQGAVTAAGTKLVHAQYRQTPTGVT